MRVTFVSVVLGAAVLAACGPGEEADGGAGGGRATGGGSAAVGGGAATGGGQASGGGEATGGGDGAGGGDPGVGGGSATGGGGGGTATGGGSATGGGTGSDAGRPDGGNRDGGCGGLMYCEDFEGLAGAITNNQLLGPWKATVNGGGVVRVDTGRARSGTHALHVTVPNANTGSNGTLRQSATAGLIPGNNLFGRAEIFYASDSGYGLPLSVHSWFFQTAGKSIDGGSVNMNLGGGGTKLQLNYHPPAPLGEQSVQGGTMTAGTWHCVQWQIDGTGRPPKNEAKVWLDGNLAFTVAATKGWDFATPWTGFDFGFTHYQTTVNAVDVYLDDFALDEAMIPCQP